MILLICFIISNIGQHVSDCEGWTQVRGKIIFTSGLHIALKSWETPVYGFLFTVLLHNYWCLWKYSIVSSARCARSEQFDEEKWKTHTSVSCFSYEWPLTCMFYFAIKTSRLQQQSAKERSWTLEKNKWKREPFIFPNYYQIPVEKKKILSTAQRIQVMTIKDETFWWGNNMIIKGTARGFEGKADGS